MKTSSWVETPAELRQQGGAIFVISAMVVRLPIIMALLHTMRVEDFGPIFSFNCGIDKRNPTSCRGFFVFQCLDTTPVISHILMLKLIIVVLSLGKRPVS